MAEIFYYDASNIIEQGNITSSGTTSSSSRIRSSIYIKIEMPLLVCQTISIHVESVKTVNVDLLGYTSNSTDKLLFDLYWYDNDYVFDVSSYNTMRYVKFVIKFEDDTNITPSDITSCVLTFTYNDPIWNVIDDKLVNKYSPDLPSEVTSPPYPYSMWRSNDNKLVNLLLPTLPSKTLLHPYPYSIWENDPMYGLLNDLLPMNFVKIKLMWHVKNDKLVNDLLPELYSDTLIKPYPYSIWRLGDDNTVTNLLLGNSKYNVEPDIPVEEPDEDKTNPSNYANIIDKPKLNGIDIFGQITLDDLGIKEMTSSMVSKLLLETFDIIL